MTKVTVVLSALLAGCGGGNKQAVDAAPTPDAAHPDAPVCNHTLFLNFEGATLTKGTDDAAMDVASVVGGPSTVAAYRANDAARATKIQTIFSQVRTTLMPFGVDVVMTRPAAGAYHMVILAGGDARDIGLTKTVIAKAPVPSCPNPVPRAVAVIFADTYNASGTNLAGVANFTIAEYGITEAIPASDRASDCMCALGSQCGTISTACAIGGSDTPRDMLATTNCGSGATFDEHAAFVALPCD